MAIIIFIILFLLLVIQTKRIHTKKKKIKILSEIKYIPIPQENERD